MICKGEEDKVGKKRTDGEREQEKLWQSRGNKGMEREGEIRRRQRVIRDSSTTVVCSGNIHQSNRA